MPNQVHEQIAIIRALGSAGAHEAVDELVPFLGPEHLHAVRLQAGHSLGLLGQHAASAAPALLQVLETSRDEGVCASALKALTRVAPKSMAPTVIRALREVVQRQSGSLSYCAVKSMGDVQHPQACEALIAWLDHPDRLIQSNARDGLSRQRSPDCVEMLSDLLQQQTNARVRLEALKALVAIRAPSSVPVLCEALQDTDADVRGCAMRGVLDFGGEQALKHLEAIHSASSIECAAQERLRTSLSRPY